MVGPGGYGITHLFIKPTTLQMLRVNRETGIRIETGTTKHDVRIMSALTIVSVFTVYMRDVHVYYRVCTCSCMCFQ